MKYLGFATVLILILCQPLMSRNYNETEKIIENILSESITDSEGPVKAEQGSEPAPRTDRPADVESSETVDQAQTGSHGSDTILLKTGVQLYRGSRHNSAEIKFRKLISEYPQSPFTDNARIWLGRIYLDTHRYGKAIEELELIPENSGERPQARFMMGIAYRSAGKNEEALEELSKVITLYPDHERADNALLEMARLQLNDNQGLQALESTVSLIKNYSDRETIDEAYYLLGQIFETDRTLKDPEKARRIYKLFLKKSDRGDNHFKNSPLKPRIIEHIKLLNKNYFMIRN